MRASGVRNLDPMTAVLVPQRGVLRAVRPGPDGALYVTTSNGDDDEVLRVSPA